MGHCRKPHGIAGVHHNPTAVLRLLPALLLALLPLTARALCTSDNVPQPAVVLERFINADCAECWRDPATPKAEAGTLVLDWVIPGRQKADAPLAVVALDEAMERLYTLRRPVPARTEAVTSRREGEPVPLRLAQGQAFNDYVGASIELKDPPREPWHAWLLLVEALPAGIEGSPVPRNLVRNVFRPDWSNLMRRNPGRLAETRAMQIRAGAQPERLRLVAVMQDGRGRIRAITQTECP
jgi:hypothetical protein